jgi:hypothetical protein
LFRARIPMTDHLEFPPFQLDIRHTDPRRHRVRILSLGHFQRHGGSS